MDYENSGMCQAGSRFEEDRGDQRRPGDGGPVEIKGFDLNTINPVEIIR